jgi:hypothetical protein
MEVVDNFTLADSVIGEKIIYIKNLEKSKLIVDGFKLLDLILTKLKPLN